MAHLTFVHLLLIAYEELCMLQTDAHVVENLQYFQNKRYFPTPSIVEVVAVRCGVVLLDISTIYI